MRARTPFAVHDGSLISSYSAKFAEALAIKQAELDARAARAEAELSIRARSEFLSNMNHELRTPLNAIIGFATMLRDSDAYPLADEQRRAYADYVLQSADLLLGHINTILETAALDGGSVEIDKSVIDLDAALDAAIERASIAAKAAGVVVARKGAKTGATGWGDAQRFGQALDHLLRMAVKASPKGQRVFVRTSLGEQGWPEIAIRDHGPGHHRIAIAKALSVFDEVHRGLDRSFAGPGVGLAIAKTFIEMQGGRFAIDSRIGAGTIARISLPPSEEAAGRDHEAERPTEAAPMRLAG
ncbi:MAG: HAMP domain-containing sensor histidine kinase [Pseudomonadota bacterium]|nr:HAMP domain-containing sensor histidine kinase [Pseudomonadota bacterium]